MEDGIERLRLMLEDRADWGRLSAEPLTIPEQTYLSSDPEDDEKVLSYEHRVGGRLEHVTEHTAARDAEDFPKYSLQFAEEAPVGEIFCALKALQAYPYNYISAANRERVVKEFFANGLFYERAWDFFYIHSLFSPVGGRKSIILISLRQFQHFLLTINSTLKTNLKLPDNTRDSPIYFEFPQDGTPRPRYLGHTTEREMAECLKKAIPSSRFTPESSVEAEREPTGNSLEAFKKKIDMLLESDKRKRVANKEKKKIERFAKQQAWNHEIKRVQRYLGLRKIDSGFSETHKTGEGGLMNTSRGSANVGIAEQLALEKSSDSKVIDIDNPAPYIQEDAVVFICVDVEAYERDHNLVTEIGISTLDTADIKKLGPGEGGSNWMKAIRARHFRVEENKHLKNHEFVNGCAEYFRFGESEWVSIKNAPQEVSKCFKPPYSQIVQPFSDHSEAPINLHHGIGRSIVLVGHDVIADINYLKKIGYDVSNLSNLKELIDTSCMYRAFQRESQPRNLGSILANLDIAGWYLHNAGNDAVYTLQAMIGIATRALVGEPNDVSRQKERALRIEESIQDAKEAAHKAQQGWSSQGSDGGSPISLARRLRPKISISRNGTDNFG